MIGKHFGITKHQQNTQVSMMELSKIMNNLAPPIMDFFTPPVNNFDLKNLQKFVTGKKHCQMWHGNVASDF